MSTTKSRLNITLPDDVHEMLSRLARRDRIPQATKAGRPLEVALELEEDQVWDLVASTRDTPGARFVSHTKAWG
jgi:hypothetical protein